MSDLTRCKALSEDGRRCHGDVGHRGTHWVGASRVWTDAPQPLDFGGQQIVVRPYGRLDGLTSITLEIPEGTTVDTPLGAEVTVTLKVVAVQREKKL